MTEEEIEDHDFRWKATSANEELPSGWYVCMCEDTHQLFFGSTKGESQVKHPCWSESD